jgi:magnesium chelatase subunit H
MPKPISPAEASAPRIVIVTMDSHFGGAVDKARAMLRRQIPGLELTLHAADEFAGDEAALAECHTDIARADIIIAGMLFLEDHFKLVQDAIAARRLDCDALVCCLSAPEITRMTRMGRLDMAAEAKGLMGLEAAARQEGRWRRQRQGPDEDAARIAEAAALHPRHGPGSARLFPDAAVLAGGFCG